MKRLITIFLSVVFLVSSCENYLDVNPKDQMARTDALSKQQTYYDALNGVYLMLGSNELFGHHLTYGLIEQMARNHSIKSDDPIFFWQYSDTNLLGTVYSIWNKMYSTIANVNSILDEIDNNKEVFDEGVYELFKGELLTIRAYAHYTLLKLYAPDYNENKSAEGIPYRTVYKNPLITPFSSVEKVFEYILGDLKEAETLLASADPVIANGFGDFATAVSDFVSGPTIKENRRLRFNYWGNIAIQARVYQSMSDFPKAYEFANMIIEQENTFQWVKQKDAPTDVIYFTEVIAGIQIPKMTDHYKDYFESEKYITTQDKKNYIADQVFESSTIGSFDYRMIYLFSSSASINSMAISKKYNQVNSSKIELYDGYALVPTVKLGEMYLIAAEAACHITPEDLSIPISLVDKLRLHRGNITTLNKEITFEELLDFILKEFRRELYLEGQLFYQYKRLNVHIMPDLTQLGYIDTRDDTYLLPIPEVELEENN